MQELTSDFRPTLTETYREVLEASPNKRSHKEKNYLAPPLGQLGGEKASTTQRFRTDGFLLSAPRTNTHSSTNTCTHMEVTRSKVKAETKTGRLSFEIETYSALPCKQGDATYSPIMECANHQWQLLLKPGGGRELAGDSDEVREMKRDSVALFLWYKGSSSHLKTKYSLRLVNQLGLADRVVEHEVSVKFSTSSNAFGGPPPFFSHASYLLPLFPPSLFSSSRPGHVLLHRYRAELGHVLHDSAGRSEHRSQWVEGE